MFIILSSDDAAAVSGLNEAGDAALAPRMLANGMFALPVTVLSDPAHSAHHGRLAILVQRAVAPHEWATLSEHD